MEPPPTYSYSKLRSEFGKHCNFSDRGPELLQTLPPMKDKITNYIQKDPISRGTMLGKLYASHEANTERVEFETRAMNHLEGGWPKDINFNDVEQTVRFRRKIEKDEGYLHTVLNLSHRMEQTIHQNNAINIYEKYYADVDPTPIVERSHCRTVNVYRAPPPNRPVTNLSWSPDSGSHLAITHCNMTFQGPNPTCTHSYIWDVENPNSPDLILKPTVPVCFMEYNPKDPHILNAGLWSGQVGFFDTRRGSAIVDIVVMDVAPSIDKRSLLIATSSFNRTKWCDYELFSKNLHKRL